MTTSSRTSDILAELSNRTKKRLTLADITRSLKDRAFALLVVILGLPNCLPMPPPIPLICGFILLFVAVQMAWGQKVPWLPRRLRYKAINKKHAEKALERAIPLMRKLEHWSEPRFAFLQTDWAMRGIGGVLCVLALSLLVAFPIIGQIPLGFSICLIGLGLVERDGIAIVLGSVIGVLGVSATMFFNYSLIVWALQLIGL